MTVLIKITMMIVGSLSDVSCNDESDTGEGYLSNCSPMLYLIGSVTCTVRSHVMHIIYHNYIIGN